MDHDFGKKKIWVQKVAKMRFCQKFRGVRKTLDNVFQSLVCPQSCFVFISGVRLFAVSGVVWRGFQPLSSLWCVPTHFITTFPHPVWSMAEIMIFRNFHLFFFAAEVQTRCDKGHGCCHTSQSGREKFKITCPSVS